MSMSLGMSTGMSDLVRHINGLCDEQPFHTGWYLKDLRSGEEGGNHEINSILAADLIKAEIIGLPAAILVLIVVFGALVAASLPLALAAISIIVALGLTALLGRTMDLLGFHHQHDHHDRPGGRHRPRPLHRLALP